MRPDLQQAMRDALELGPGHCPPDLFAGPVEAVVAGLKAHDSTIAAARLTALEHTYPRTEAMVGEREFAALARAHCEQLLVRSRPLHQIGLGFPARLHGAVMQLASLEWAWLESYGAPESAALEPSAIGALEPGELVRLEVVLHPATRWVAIAGPLEFDGTRIDGPTVLVTRPAEQVRLSSAPASARCLLALLDRPRAIGELLAIAADSMAAILASGALMVGR